MRIGILGCGKVGRALGAWAAREGCAVAFTSRTPEHAREAAREAGESATAVDLEGLVAASDVLLLTLPFTEVLKTLEPVREALAGKVLVDVTNPLTADHRGLSLGHDDSGAERIARHLPAARVVKAFNAVFAEVYAARQSRLEGRAVTVFYAGDEEAAKARVRELLVRLGFDAVDAGPLRNARYLEPLSLLNIHLGRELGWGAHIGFSLLRAR